MVSVDIGLSKAGGASLAVTGLSGSGGESSAQSEDDRLRSVQRERTSAQFTVTLMVKSENISIKLGILGSKLFSIICL